MISNFLSSFRLAIRKKQLGFSKQIMLILVSLSIICTGLMGIMGYTITDNLNNELVLNRLQAQTDSTYNLIDSVVSASIKNHLRTIAEMNKNIIELYYTKYTSGEISEDAAKREVERNLLRQRVGETGYVYIVDSKATLQVHPLLKNTNLSTYAFIQTQIEQKQGYLEYSWKNPSDNKERKKALYMTYFEPWDYIISVSSYKDEFITLVNTTDFRNNILSIVLGETGYMYVINSQGKLIIHPKQEGTSIYDSVDSQGNLFIQEIIRNKNGMIVYPWKNPDEEFSREKIVIYKYYEPMDWYICSGVYINEVVKPIEKMKFKFIAISLFIIVIAACISIVYSRVIVNPIKNLIDATEMVAIGNFDITIKKFRNDEIGRLTDIFNKMTREIKNYMGDLLLANRKLEEINTNLEEKVQDRTQQLELLSNLDGLTGIANRRKMDEYLQHAWNLSHRNTQPLSLIFIDIDFFKNYNDTYGHPAGDECLKKIATTISGSLKRSTDFAARYGGEEFIVILNNTGQAGAAEIAECIRKDIERLRLPHASSPVAEVVTVSMGTSTLVSFADIALQGFVQSADEALYAAKQSGKNRLISVEYPQKS